jgi:hypothetical protein
MAQSFAAGGLVPSGRRADHAASELGARPAASRRGLEVTPKQSGSLACVDTSEVITRSERE